MTSLKLKRICTSFIASTTDYWENSSLTKTNPTGPKAVDMYIPKKTPPLKLKRIYTGFTANIINH